MGTLLNAPALATLRTGTYRTIVVDPPWPYGAWGPASDVASSRRKFPHRQCFQSWALPYSALSLPAIRALPVAALAAADCDLYLSVDDPALSGSGVRRA